MASLQQRQAQMMAYLLAGDRSIHDYVQHSETMDADQRLQIYSTGYRLRLKETLAVDHQILAAYMGEEGFDDLCNNFIEACPSQQKSLRYFAEPLPDFLADRYPEYPQLAELALFERKLLFSFDAQEREPLARDFLQHLPVEQWPSCQLAWQPSLQIVDFNYNVVSIWQALKQDQRPPAPHEQKSRWAIWRSADRLTQFVSLQDEPFRMLQALANGQSLSHACEVLLTQMPEHEVPAFLQQQLQQCIARGMLCLASSPERED